MGVYVLVFPCISVDVCAYKSASVCVMVEVSFGNRLIITAAPSFIIFIEFFPASALGACKSYKFNTTGCRAFTVCVCVCVHTRVRIPAGLACRVHPVDGKLAPHPTDVQATSTKLYSVYGCKPVTHRYV